MFAYACRIALAAATCALTVPALAQTLTHKDISADIAVTIATTAMADCKVKGYKVSAAVVGRVGEIIVQVRGDGTGPIPWKMRSRRRLPRAHLGFRRAIWKSA
jgi:uncharacterized protein GlcG (DUF336 family)